MFSINFHLCCSIKQSEQNLVWYCRHIHSHWNSRSARFKYSNSRISGNSRITVLSLAWAGVEKIKAINSFLFKRLNMNLWPPGRDSNESSWNSGHAMHWGKGEMSTSVTEDRLALQKGCWPGSVSVSSLGMPAQADRSFLCHQQMSMDLPSEVVRGAQLSLKEIF